MNCYSIIPNYKVVYTCSTNSHAFIVKRMIFAIYQNDPFTSSTKNMIDAEEKPWMHGTTLYI